MTVHTTQQNVQTGIEHDVRSSLVDVFSANGRKALPAIRARDNKELLRTVLKLYGLSALRGLQKLVLN